MLRLAGTAAICAMLLALVQPCAARGAAGCAGTLDPTFQVQDGFPSLWSWYPPFLALTVQADGKVVVSDGTFDWSQQVVTWQPPVRFNSDGSVDVNYVPNLADVSFHTRAVQADGKTLELILTADAEVRQVIRRNADGSLDNSFMPDLPADFQARAIAIQPGGGILVSGGRVVFTAMAGMQKSYACEPVLRLQPDGSRDRTFFTGLTLDTGPDSTDGNACLARDMVAGPDGKIYIGGFFTRINGLRRTDVARLNADGTLDLTFEADIEVCVGCDIDAQETVSALGLAPDGKLVIAGRLTTINSLPRQSVARLHTSDDGCSGVISLVAERMPAEESGAQAIVTVLRHGGTTSRVSVSYRTFTNDYPEFVEAAAGSDYRSQTGVLEFAPGESRKTISLPLANDSACEPNERIWLKLTEPTGGALLRTPAKGYVLVMDDEARGRPGNVDISFRPEVRTWNSYSGIEAIAVGNQRIWIAGHFDQVDGASRPGFARLHLDGRVDPTFAPIIEGQVLVLAREPGSGRILAGGDFQTINGVGAPGLVRFSPDGILDEAFHPRSFGTVTAIGFAPDGKIVLGGMSGAVRINGDGTADPSFHSGGYAWVNGDVYSIAVQPDGKVVVGGFFFEIEGQPIRHIARLNVDGTLDRGFQPVGATNHSFVFARGVSALPDGKIMIAGYFESLQGLSRVGLVRLNYDGTVDRAFDSRVSGVVDVFAMQPGGKVLAVANYSDFGAGGRPVRGIARFLPDGSQDPSFFVASAWCAFENKAIALEPNGDVLAAGTGEYINGFPRPALFRLHGDQTGIRPNDPGAISFSAPQYSVSEDGGAATIKAVRIWGTHGTISTRFSTEDTTATAGLDYWSTQKRITFADGEAAEKTVTIPVLDDLLGDGNETVGLTLGDAIGGTSLGCFAGAQLAIVENDEIVQFASPVYAVSEGEGLVRVEFGATGKRDVPVTVQYTTHDGTALAGRDYSSTSGSTTLPGAGCGYLPAIPILNDTLAEGTKAFTMSLSIASGTATLGPNDKATVYILDDESPGPFIYRQPVPVARVAGQTATLTVGAVGRAPLSYQWRFAGENIPGATASDLALNNVQADSSGRYDVLISDAAGTISSEPVSLIVLQVPSGPGSIDVTFDPSHGGTTPGFQEPDGYVNALAVEPDGDIVIGGAFEQFDGVRCNGLMRLKPDGSLDPSFVLTPYGTLKPISWWSVNALALAPNGKILVAFDRFLDLPAGQFGGVIRLNPDGMLDTSFKTPTNIYYAFVNAVAVQPDGKVLLGGVIETQSGPEYRHILRFKPDGSLDTSFKPVPLSSDGEPRNAVNNILVQPDGKIVLLGGFSRIDVPSCGGLVRLLPDGAVDSSFDHGFNVWTESSCVLAQQADGKLILGAPSWDGSSGRSMMRLLPDGNLDPTFAPPRLDTGVRSLALLPDGTLLVATNQWDRGGLLHLHQGGAIDPNFHAALEPSEGAFVATVAALPNGQAMIGGRFGLVNGYPATNLARLNTGALSPFVSRQLPFHGGSTVRLLATPASGVAAYAVEDRPPAGWGVANITHGGTFDSLMGQVKFGPFYDSESRALSYDAFPPPWGTHGLLGVFFFNGVAAADGSEFPVQGDQHLTIAGMMPADLNPADHAIGIGEVTGYGAAWRHGTAWAVGPNPIPINYVTRAAALWRLGERYTEDRSATQEPLFWVPWPGTNGFPDQALLSPTLVERQLPPAFVPGESLTVTLLTTPSEGVAAHAIEDQAPALWKIGSVSHDGEYDAASGKVRWGPFCDNVQRVLQYEVRPPQGAAGTVEFVGLGSCDGVSSPIAGASRLSEGCRLAAVASVETGKITLTVSGRVGVRFHVEVSDDLQTWNRLAVFTNTTGQIQVFDPEGITYRQRFYRAVLAAESE